MNHWVSSRFSRSKYKKPMYVLWSRRHCIKWQLVQLIRPVMLHQRLHQKKKKKWNNNNNMQVQKTVSKMANRTALNFLWRNYVGDFRLVEFTLHMLQVPKERKKQTRLTLAPNRGSLGVLWTYSVSIVVLSWDLTHKNTQTSTKSHACRVTLTPARSGDANTRFAPSAYKTHTFAQRHKSDKNIPVNLAKTATAALPFLY